MAIKRIRRGFNGKTWAQFHKAVRKSKAKFWKKNCSWVCRPRLCEKAALYLIRNLPAMESLEANIKYSFQYPEQKLWL